MWLKSDSTATLETKCAEIKLQKKIYLYFKLPTVNLI